MKIRLRHGLSVVAITLLCMLTSVFTAFAANITGDLDMVNNSEISGWAIDKDFPDKVAEVGLYIYTDGSAQAKELAKINADQYRSDSSKLYEGGNHGFTYPVNWDEVDGTSFIVQAYVLVDGQPALLLDSLTYSKSGESQSLDVVKVAAGPATGTQEEQPAPAAVTAQKDNYLGKFVTTAYCCCTRCSGGSGKTYSGTIPKANHTISADIQYYPIGTKLMIGNTVYTVEDIGTGVNGNILDIYFNTHQEALNYGRKTVDVYAVQ